MENVAGMMESGMAPAVLRTLRDVARAAEECGVEPFLVGGFVRDLFLGISGSPDMDVALVGATANTFDDIARLVRGETTKRSQFNTVRMKVEDYDFDVIMARSERYPTAGSLPIVRQGTLEEDLARRDFSVNAMAVSLSDANWGLLYDPQRGLHDLRNGTLRVLYDDSFRDDATRILRAARYASRLSFELSHETRDAIINSVGSIADISAARVRDELERVFLETNAAAALDLMQRWGALFSIHPALRYDSGAWGRFSGGVATLSKRERIAVGYSIFGSDMMRSEATGVEGRLSPGSLGRRTLEESAVLSERIADGGFRRISNSELASILDALSEYSVLGSALAMSGSPIGDRMDEYLRCHRNVQAELSGREIIALGVAEGPEVGSIRRQLRVARLDGLVSSREEEEAFVLNRLKASP